MLSLREIFFPITSSVQKCLAEEPCLLTVGPQAQSENTSLTREFLTGIKWNEDDMPNFMFLQFSCLVHVFAFSAFISGT